MLVHNKHIFIRWDFNKLFIIFNTVITELCQKGGIDKVFRLQTFLEDSKKVSVCLSEIISKLTYYMCSACNLIHKLVGVMSWSQRIQNKNVFKVTLNWLSQHFSSSFCSNWDSTDALIWMINNMPSFLFFFFLTNHLTFNTYIKQHTKNWFL